MNGDIKSLTLPSLHANESGVVIIDTLIDEENSVPNVMEGIDSTLLSRRTVIFNLLSGADISEHEFLLMSFSLA